MIYLERVVALAGIATLVFIFLVLDGVLSGSAIVAALSAFFVLSMVRLAIHQRWRPQD